MPPPSSKKPARGKRIQQLKIEAATSSEVEVRRSSRNVFPFFELSPELRNQIYELSLHHDRKNGITANVTLLRVNKQICIEAQEYLFDHGTFYIEVDEEYVKSRSEWRTDYDCLTVKGDMVYKHNAPRSIGSQFGCHHIWPNALRKLQRVHILLKGDGAKTAELFKSFAKFLRSYPNQIKSVIVEVVEGLDIDWLLGHISGEDRYESDLTELPECISVQFATSDQDLQQYLDNLRADWLKYLDNARQGRLRLPSKD